MSASPCRVLIIDDDEDTREALSEALTDAGLLVDAVATGAAALRRIEEAGEPDVILLDLRMPGMDGVEFIRRLVECKYGGSVILVSGENSRILESVERLIEAHRLIALGCLQKPVQPRELASLRAAESKNPQRRAPAKVYWTAGRSAKDDWYVHVRPLRLSNTSTLVWQTESSGGPADCAGV